MMSKNIVVVACCALILAASGCSRQQSDWQKTRETNTAEAYEQYLKKYPTGEFTAQAQARVKGLYEERDWLKARDTDTPEAYQAFLKQYPEGKWTEEARIRVENFTLAQAPSGAAAAAPGTAAAPGGAEAGGAPPVMTGQDVTTPPPARTAVSPASPGSTPQATAKAAVKAGSGSFGVQLGAFKSGAGAAHERWAHLQKQFPSLLAGLSSKVVAKKTNSGNLYRLQATGLTEKRARAICTSLRAKAQACVVIPAAGR